MEECYMESVWGVLDFCKVKYMFTGGGKDIQEYFKGFYLSINKVKLECVFKTIYVRFIEHDGDLKYEIVEGETTELLPGILFISLKNGKIVCFCKDSWIIEEKEDLIEVRISGRVLRFLDVLNQCLRDVIIRNARKYDVIGLHAACLKLTWGNVLLFGLSGSGKSTLSIGAGLYESNRLLSDDRVVLCCYEKHSYITSFGFPITFRAGTSKICPELRKYEESVPVIAFSDKEMNYKYKVGVDYYDLFGYKRIYYLLDNLKCVFLQRDDSGVAGFQKMSDEELKSQLIAYWECGEIVCDDIELLLDKFKNNSFKYLYPFGGGQAFQDNVQILSNGPLV